MLKNKRVLIGISLTAVLVLIGIVIIAEKQLYKGPLVYSHEKIVINYSKYLNQVDLLSQNIEVLDTKGNKVNINVSFFEDSKNIVIITPPEIGYKSGKKYTLNINSDISFNIGDKIKGTKQWEFKGKKDKVIKFTDANLEGAVRRQIGKLDGEIYVSEVYKLNTLNAGNLKIENLEGIEELTSLKILGLSDNNITNIKDIKNLKQLEILALTDNKINDIKALKELKNLNTLWLSGNDIMDYSPVSGYFKNLIAKDFKLN